MDRTVLVTGGAGFIGSALVRHLLRHTSHRVVNADSLTYAGNLESLAGVLPNDRYGFEHVDICDARALARIFAERQPDAVVHLAAETHVDRSIDSAAPFIQSNIVGTYTLLEAARAYWLSLGRDGQARFRFLHVSTDEVFGSLDATGCFDEHTPYRPRSPYSASKASSDHLVRAWHATHGLPVLVATCSNNYGPCQFPEKLIPVAILSALRGQAIPVYGDGSNVRDWLYVDDHVRALLALLERGRVGETYAIGGRSERSNLEVVRTVCSIMDELVTNPAVRPHESLITFVPDRPGHDWRYAIDPGRVEAELGWRPRETFATGLRRTVTWYLENLPWCERILSGEYRLGRLGKPAASRPL